MVSQLQRYLKQKETPLERAKKANDSECHQSTKNHLVAIPGRACVTLEWIPTTPSCQVKCVQTFEDQTLSERRC